MFNDNPSVMMEVLGAFLMLLGIIGGGVELKELKVPKIGWFPRILTVAAGLFVLLIGVGMSLKSDQHAAVIPTAVAAQPTAVIQTVAAAQPVEAPQTIPSNFRVQEDYLRKQVPKLPDQSGISQAVKNEVATLIINADIAEVEAVFYQNPAYLETYYQGDALSEMNSYIDQVRQTGAILYQELDANRSYYTDMHMVADGVLAVNQCEFWKNTYYDPQTGQKVREEDWTLVPQTINIELVNNQPAITSISFYEGKAFCTR